MVFSIKFKFGDGSTLLKKEIDRIQQYQHDLGKKNDEIIKLFPHLHLYIRM